MTTIKLINAKATYPVRHSVLRKGKPIETCFFKGDMLPTTLHIGLFFNNKLSGVATLLTSQNALYTNKNQYQLRGMAILDKHQGKGFGNLIIDFTIALLKDKNCDILWCNAREVAKAFYIKNGFSTTGKPFNIEGIGKHYIMQRSL
ncbi:GNAT family N-acetyltransferase [Postechiella marina]|uniref:GNAT family N-acetyltransferase n=1 Tax=Postechiella marina TaxID=943941 RepID=A0ABP8CFA7_9FLAO